MTVKVHYPAEDQSPRRGYGGYQHNPRNSVISACGVVFTKAAENNRYTSNPRRVTCGSCIKIAELEAITGRSTWVPHLRVLDGGAA